MGSNDSSIVLAIHVSVMIGYMEFTAYLLY